MSRLLPALVAVLLVLGLVAWLGGGDRGETPTEPDAGGAPVDQGEAADLAAPTDAERERAVAPLPPPVAPESEATELAAPDRPTAEPRVLLTGRVVDGLGAAVPDANVRLERHVVDSGGFGMRSVEIRPLTRLDTRTDAEGRFEVRGEAEGTVVARAEKSGYVLREQIEPSLPAEGVILTLDRAGALLVTLAPAALELATSLQVEVRASGDERDVQHAVDAFRDGRALREGLRPGLYDVVLVGRRSHRALHTVADVVVRAGETTEDPRLTDLDLRAALRTVRVTVVDADGQRIRNATVWVHDGSAATGHQTREGWIDLTVDEEGADVAVREPGWREVRHTDVHEDLVIRLQRPIRLRLLRPSGPSSDLGDLYVYLGREQVAGEESTATVSADVILPADEDGVEVEMDAAGSYGVQWAAAIDYAGGGTGYIYPRDTVQQVVEVTEAADAQELVLDLDPAVVATLGRRVAALADELTRQPGESDEEHQRRTLEVILRESRAGSR